MRYVERVRKGGVVVPRCVVVLLRVILICMIHELVMAQQALGS